MLSPAPDVLLSIRICCSRSGIEAATARSTKIPVKILKMANAEKKVYLVETSMQLQDFPIKVRGSVFSNCSMFSKHFRTLLRVEGI